MTRALLLLRPITSMVSSLRAVIFDFDGLVVDTESIGYRTWNEIFECHGQALSIEQYALVVGTNFETAYDPRRDLEARTGKSFDWPTLEARRREREIALGLELKPLPGVKERLEEARALGLRTAIASSSTRTWIQMWMQRLNLGSYFEHISTVDDTGKVKPDPSLFMHAADNLQTGPLDVLIFEDSLNGLHASMAAGMRCIAAPSPMTRHLDFQNAWKRVNSLSDVSLRSLQAEW